jgi:hypothetical protein
MVAAHLQNMIPIPNPYVGEWAIDQVFQLRIRLPHGDAFAFGYYDRIQEQYIIQIGRGGGGYFAVGANFTLREVILAAVPGALVDDGWFEQAAWVRPELDAPMPPLHDTAALLALTMGWLHRDGNASSFDFRCEVAEQQEPQA